MVRTLVVDDELRMRQLVRLYLENANFEVYEAPNGQAALQAMMSEVFHLVILDLMMPNLDGWRTCSTIRAEHPDVPVLMLTARSSIEDKVAGFSTGADDYLTKPFDGRELVVRAKALVRRSQGQVSREIRLSPIGLTVDQERRTITIGEMTLACTPTEYEMLVLFARRPGKTFSREELLQLAWGYDYEGDARTVDSHIKNIREKLKSAGLKQDPIKTVWGIGYKLEA